MAKADPPGSPLDQRLDLLWEQSYATYYDVYFQEIRYEFLLRRLGIADKCASLLVAATTIGTGISGWSLWGTEVGKAVWTGIAALAALFAMIHAGLEIADRKKRHLDIYPKLRALRRSFESLRRSIQRNKITPTPENVDRSETRYNELGDEHLQIDKDVAPLGMLDVSMERIQDALDQRLAKEGWT